MKILELEINEIRGIKNLTLTPNGETIVVWGPNGTGKSGVIDAVDFLLTGKVTRLSGKGTQGLTLKTHGSHIDSTGDESYVSAKIKIQGISEPVTLKREISNPNYLEINGCDEEVISPIKSIAERGQHVLTRREILDYITSEPSTRAQQIQTLLNIYEIERIRQNLVKISNKATKSVAAT
jgi:DNA repair exonuclease SbcCD ATPase subunit